MTDPDQVDQLIRRRLTAYSREVSADVKAPGAHDVYRAVKHRQKRRVAVGATAADLSLRCLRLMCVGRTCVRLRCERLSLTSACRRPSWLSRRNAAVDGRE